MRGAPSGRTRRTIAAATTSSKLRNVHTRGAFALLLSPDFKFLNSISIHTITLREERRLRVFENWVLRGIFGPRRVGVTGEWRKLHNDGLNDLYC